VILAEEVQARSGPGDGYQVSFTLHAGTRVCVAGKKYEWDLVRLPNKLEGWVPSTSLEEV